MTGQLEPMKQIQVIEYDVHLLNNAVKHMNPDSPNMGQLKFIQVRLQMDQKQIVTLLNNPQVPQDVKDRLGRAYGDLSYTDEAIDDVESGKVEFSVVLQGMDAAESNLSVILNPPPKT